MNIEEMKKYKDSIDDIIHTFELLELDEKVKKIITDRLKEISSWMSVNIVEDSREYKK